MFRKTRAPKRARSPEQASKPVHTHATPLHTAAIAGDLEGVKRILRNRNRGYSVDTVDHNSHTAVWHAIYEGHTEVARTMLFNTYCPCAFPDDVRDKTGTSEEGIIIEYQIAREVAAMQHEEKEWQELLNTPVNFDFDIPAQPAAGKKHKAANVAPPTLFQPAAPAVFGKTTYLHAAVSLNGVTPSQQKRRLLRVKQELMDPNLDIDAVNEHGYTALHIASIHGRTDEMIALLARGANKNFVSPNPLIDSPYKWVSERGSNKMKEIMGVVPQQGLRN